MYSNVHLFVSLLACFDFDLIFVSIFLPKSSAQTPTPAFLAKPKTVSIIGAPMNYGQPFGGTELGPAVLRAKGLRTALTKLDWRVDEQGDLSFDNQGTNLPGG